MAAPTLQVANEPRTRVAALARSGFPRSNAALVVLILLLSYAYAALAVLAYLRQPVGLFDESIQLVGGMLVLKGQVPHKDFWSMYPPLNYYINAGAFLLLGKSVFSARIVQSVSFIALTAVLFRNSLNELSPYAKLALCLGAFSIAVIGDTFNNASWNAYVIGLFGIVSYLHCI